MYAAQNNNQQSINDGNLSLSLHTAAIHMSEINRNYHFLYDQYKIKIRNKNVTITMTAC